MDEWWCISQEMPLGAGSVKHQKKNVLFLREYLLGNHDGTTCLSFMNSRLYFNHERSIRDEWILLLS